MTEFYFQNVNMPKEAFDILKSTLTRQLKARKCKVTGKKTEGAICLEFTVNARMKADSFKITEEDGKTVIAANDTVTVFAGAGRYLVLGQFDGVGGFTPPALPVSHKMRKSVRGIYLATHFYNFHHNSPLEAELEYVADQALRGFNSIMLVLAPQHYDSFLDPEPQEMIARLKAEFEFSKKIGMVTAIIGFSNTGFRTFPQEFAAKTFNEDVKKYGGCTLHAVYVTEVCPSTEGGMKEVERIHRQFFEAFADAPIDYYYLWPWDEGGCLCDDCYPWSTNGFMKVADLDRKLMKEYGLEWKMCFSSWHFGLFQPDEWQNFCNHIASGEYDECPYFMVSYQGGRVPGPIRALGKERAKKYVDFPEVSMNNPAVPWGGFGATPFPMYLNNVEENTGEWHDGGYLYSEGIYEDINKYMISCFYTGYEPNTEGAMREYFAYEFGFYDKETQDKLVECCRLMESAHKRKQIKDPENPDKPWKFQVVWGCAIPEVKRIIDACDKKIGKAYKQSRWWRLMVCRANLDFLLYSNGWQLKGNEEAQKYLKEVWDISCACDKCAYAVLPPLGK